MPLSAPRFALPLTLSLPLPLFPIHPLANPPEFITYEQLIRQMHDRYRAPSAVNCYCRLITQQISYLNPTPSHTVIPPSSATLRPLRAPRPDAASAPVERTRLSCLFGQCDGRIEPLRMDDRYSRINNRRVRERATATAMTVATVEDALLRQRKTF